MMMRVIAFALNAHEHLAFGKGLSDTDEPDLLQKDLTGLVAHWIDVGQPDEKRLIRASGRADRVTVYTYGRGADKWWEANAERLGRARNVAVWRVPTDVSESLGRLAVHGAGRAGVVQQCSRDDPVQPGLPEAQESRSVTVRLKIRVALLSSV
jgi:uncharacterized protein YaeQ